MVEAIGAHAEDLDAAARAIGDAALQAGSPDNHTVQVLRVEQLPAPEASELSRMAAGLPPAPLLSPRMEFDGHRIVRELHGSSRSHIYLALDLETHATVVLKAPSIALQGDAAYIERLLLEEWIARRVDSAHVLKAAPVARPRKFLYVVMEYVEGRTLAQWMIDHPRPPLDTVRGLVEQVARGLRALHRLEMVHQDLRPENVMIDATGTARIIDFGAVQVAGVAEMDEGHARDSLLGTAQFMAPECFLGARATPACDQFSLAVIAYQMLTGRLPYGTRVAQCRTPAEQKRLRYQPVTETRRDIPAWVDGALQKALNVQPARRYADTAEFVFALHQPDPALAPSRPAPLIERDPVVFWKSLSLLLALLCLVLLALRH
jgi:serine/threonine protein kinase